MTTDIERSGRHRPANRRLWVFYLAVGLAAGCLPPAPAWSAPALTRVRTVLLIRHGVRPPTHEPALSPAIAPEAWPRWDVPDGDLTAHGAAAIRRLAAYDRTLWAPAAGCPALHIYSDVDERTLKTGAAFAAGFTPGCTMTVRHAAGARDPLFSALDQGAAGFDAATARSQMLAAAGGSLDGFVAAHRPLFAAMQAVLQPGGHAFLDLPNRLVAKLPGRPPKLAGPIAEGASGAEDFLLEYLDGKPMDEVAWGRATPAQLAALLALHPLAYEITARPPAIAHATASSLARRILSDLTAGPAVSVLVGHDTNQAELAGLLNLHWHLGGYPADDPPPGGGIVFTLLAATDGTQYVTATYQMQTMRQIRDLAPLSTAAPPATQPLPIPGCGNNPAPTACTLTAFTALIQRLTN